MSKQITFDEAVEMAAKLTGPVPPARLWNMLATKVRAGQSIDSLATMALIASVVGKDQAAQFAQTVKNVWGQPAVKRSK